jgi:hypothetical protein
MKPSGVRYAFVALTVIGAIGSIQGQTARDRTGEPRATGQRTADPAQSGRVDSRAFVDEMTVAGMAEVQLGKMAGERGAHPDVTTTPRCRRLPNQRPAFPVSTIRSTYAPTSATALQASPAA